MKISNRNKEKGKIQIKSNIIVFGGLVWSISFKTFEVVRHPKVILIFHKNEYLILEEILLIMLGNYEKSLLENGEY